MDYLSLCRLAVYKSCVFNVVDQVGGAAVKDFYRASVENFVRCTCVLFNFYCLTRRRKTLPIIILILFLKKGMNQMAFFFLMTLVGVIPIFVREVLDIQAAPQRRIINTFSIFKFIFA